MLKTLIGLVMALMLFAAPVFAQKTADKKFWILSVATYASAVADEETTQFELRRNPGLHESNPLLGNSRKTAYPVLFGQATVSVIGSYFLKRDGSKYWFLSPVVTYNVHGFAVGYNLSLGRQR